MKTVKYTLLILAACAAWGTIGISGSVREEVAGRTIDAVQYAVLLAVSLWYLQWSLDRFLLPLDSLSKLERRELLSACRSKHKAGFFAGIVGIGYLLAILYMLSLFSNHEAMTEPPNFMVGAVFFIFLGTMAKARTLVRILAEERADKAGKFQ